MKALVRHRYGSPDTVKIEEVDTPTPGEDQVLVRVAAASMNPLDWHALTGTPWLMRLADGLRRPKSPLLGRDAAGTVVAVGAKVAGLAVGDEVFGGVNGSFAEFALGSERGLVRRTSSVSVEAAAATPIAGLTALQALRDKGGLQAGQSVLINGAAGGVGTFAVQLAVAMGATVTGVCSTANVELVRSLGAHEVIDYTQQEIGDRQFDVILDNIGNHSLRARRRMMTPTGRCVIVGGPKKGKLLGPITPMVRAVIGSWFRSRKFVPFMAATKAADLEVLAGHLADGSVVPVVSRTYGLADAAEALRSIEAGHTRGKLVLTIG
ncbi:MAG: NAD(P)-dependent alcohol dehydrogenase [Ilumatobacteraceae bacterium]